MNINHRFQSLEEYASLSGKELSGDNVSGVLFWVGGSGVPIPTRQTAASLGRTGDVSKGQEDSVPRTHNFMAIEVLGMSA